MIFPALARLHRVKVEKANEALAEQTGCHTMQSCGSDGTKNTYNMKKNMYIIFVVLNMTLTAYLTILIILMFLGVELSFVILSKRSNLVFISLLMIPLYILTVKNVIICVQNEIRKEVYFLFLLLFNIAYNPLYSFRVIRNGWIK